MEKVDLEQVAPGSASTDPAHDIDLAEERALVRKLDWNIIPTVMGLYLFSFLDRVNIGNARLYGMEADLHMVGYDYQLAVSILFVTYCLFEVPSNLVLKKLVPNRYIAGIAIAWGVIATLVGVVQNLGGLIALRILLGIFEAGLFPGLLTYLTMFYNKRDLALRVGYLFVSAALAGALGGLLAYGISFMDGVAGLRGWRWVMILEGIPSVLLGILAFFSLPGSPETASFLSPEERSMLVRVRERDIGQTASAQKFHWADVKEGALDWKLWIFSIAGFCEDIMLYGFSTFLPTIIKGIGTWTPAQAQALTVPVYVLGAITYLVIAKLSDMQQQRGLYSAGFAIVSAVGYALLCSNSSVAASYCGCFLVAMGLYVSVGLPLAWLPTNCPRYGKRALATGMQLTFGNLSGVASPFLFQTKDSPTFYTGYGVSIGALCISASIFTFMHFYYGRVNRRRAAGREDNIMGGLSEGQIQELGDRNPAFRYTT
ncbi:MFS general substrate transporter [Thozetella sp. PMI_491]|nr:MFS general substrate transporter [Thozetella sp. PMI_491]